MKKLIRLISTMRYLKLKQIYFRLFYQLRKIINKKSRFLSKINISSVELKLSKAIFCPESFDNYTFIFLNEKIEYSENNINWNETQKGKLWTYNLNYFEFLNQVSMDREQGLELIECYINFKKIIHIGMEPYPISLRGINWIKFLTFNKIKDREIDSFLYYQYRKLLENIEYHLMGNHLLENGFSLLWAAFYFNNRNFYTKAEKILKAELYEQILSDGGHFELSPMYHQIILNRLLDSINLVQNNVFLNKELLSIFIPVAENMLSWLSTITFNNGQIPLVNDSSLDIASSTADLINYAKSLGLQSTPKKQLKDSGYRKIIQNNYELLVDVGNIGPDYIPGHAHSDTFNFILHIDNKPFIVDVGTSTYERSQKRLLERSTESHNTVKINNRNQTEVWSSFRVAGRAKITELFETEKNISAIHNGYKKYGIYHKRSFSWSSSEIVIVDKILSKNSQNCRAYIHLDPGINAELVNNTISTKLGEIIIAGSKTIKIDNYERSAGFNKLESAKVIIIDFDDNLETRIKC